MLHHYEDEEKLIGEYLASIDGGARTLEASQLSLEGMKILYE